MRDEHGNGAKEMSQGKAGRQGTQFKGVIMLLLTALIWGVAFVSQSVGMKNVDAFTFNCVRTFMGAAVLLPFILIRDKKSARKMTKQQITERKALTKKTILYGSILGVVFCAASNFQQFAFNYSTPGKIAFITAMYIFFVPLFGLFLKKKVAFTTWICVICGFIGLYFLCIDQSNLGVINKGDVLAFLCAILFSAHILLIEKYAPDVDGIKLSCVQFLVSGVISGVLMMLFESPSLASINSAKIPLLYAGLMSCGIAYTFQIIGQKYTEATIASLILCMESVFAVIAAAIILHELMSGREIVGCVIMFSAIIFSQLAEMFAMKKGKPVKIKQAKE